MQHWFVDINPIAFSLGPVQVHWYGIMYLLSFAVAWWLGQGRCKAGRLPVTSEQFSDLAFYVMLGVILGGRIGYMIFYDTATLIHEPLSLIRVWQGGMSFHGGLLGVLLAGLIWTWRNDVNFFDTVDFVAPLVPIGLGLGRLGNFIGGELWGRRTDLPWGMIFPRSLEWLDKTRDDLYRMYLDGLLNHEVRHPSQVYEFALEGVVMFTVLWIYSRKPRPRYAVSGLFALLYGVFRFSVEFFREPDVQLGFLAFDWVTMGQILSLPLILVGVLLLGLSRSAPTLLPPARAMKMTADADLEKTV
ncbi:MAG: prolipoprotein diacylglyceryl transferase [Rhodanobacter sp.]|jgi:phosphatidylglycerol:prolipoprotein diacylglycerol transferase|nr:prolipoprotein diacylglyceryl transferase [Rhodanobacter sp.]